MLTDRPYLFLDVDGVVNACDQRLDVETIKREGFKIRFQPWIRECLTDLHEHFEVVWCTTWREKAEPCFAKVLGLPGKRDYVRWKDLKLPALRQYAGDRPWAFVDDDADWELQRMNDHRPRGGFIVVPDVKVGLTRDQTDALIAWAVRQPTRLAADLEALQEAWEAEEYEPSMHVVPPALKRRMEDDRLA